jgi:uncharacterized protein YcbX
VPSLCGPAQTWTRRGDATSRILRASKEPDHVVHHDNVPHRVPREELRRHRRGFRDAHGNRLAVGPGVVSISHFHIPPTDCPYKTDIYFYNRRMVVEAREARVSKRNGRSKPNSANYPSGFVSQRLDPQLARVTCELPATVLDPSWDGTRNTVDVKSSDAANHEESADLCLTLRYRPNPDRDEPGGKIPPQMSDLKIPLLTEKPLPRRHVRVWDWVGTAGDEGDDAAEWFSAILGKRVRLVRWLGHGALPVAVGQSARGTGMAFPGKVAVAVARTVAGTGALGAGFLTRRTVARMTSQNGGSIANSVDTKGTTEKDSKKSKIWRGARDVSIRALGAVMCTSGMSWVERQVVKRFDSGYLGNDSFLLPARATEKRYAPHACACFSDGFPILLANASSLDALNETLQTQGSPQIPMNRFRPNVVVGGTATETTAWAEDTWGRLLIGGNKPHGDPRPGISVELVKPCSRCAMTTVNQQDPATKIPSVTDEPLRTLASKRNGATCGFDRVDWNETPFFAWNAVSDPSRVGEEIRVGDDVRVAERRTFREKK